MKFSLFNKLIYKYKTLRVRFIYEKIDDKPIDLEKHEICLFAIARNEALRLPYFMQYYKNLGVDRIFLIDNNSDDDTVNIALSYPNVHVFRIKESFKKSWFWMEYFLDKYGQKRWCMVVDIDELFSYPYAEIVPLKHLIHYMDKYDFTAIRSLFLDIYSDKSINDVDYKQGEDPFLSCPFFDTNYILHKVELKDEKRCENFVTETFSGGMRERIFSRKLNNGKRYSLQSKISLLKYSKNISLFGGMHAINGANIANVRGVVFHTKFMQDFIKEAEVEAIREEHHNNAIEYKIYDKVCKIEPNLNLYHEKSVKYKNTRQMVKLGLMKSSIAYNNFIVDNNIDVTPLFEESI
jgi:hypothetical protein